MTTDEDPAASIDLAREPDFALGALLVSPSGCRIQGRDERLEPRVMEVLVMLARAGGATVTRDQLVDACWDGRIVSEDAITRVIAKVRNLAREFEPAPFALETIPKIGFRLVSSSPADAPATTPAVASGLGAPQPVRAPWWRSRRSLWAAALVVLIAVGVAAWLFAPRPSRPGPPALIEVMAFEPRSADPAIQRLAVSIGESLVRVLSSAGTEVAPQVGRPGEGGGPAAFRIAGSLDRKGDGYIANAQFIDRPTGVVLWSAQIERPFAEIRGFEDEVAMTIAGPLQCALEDRRRFKRPMAPRVFTLYLNACDSVARQDNPQRMLAATQQLVRAVPDEPTAHAMYGIAQAQVAGYRDFASEAELEALRRGARASAERAIRLDPNTPKAYLARAISYPDGSNWAIRERDFRRVGEIDPAMGPGRAPLILVLREVGRLHEGLETAQLASQLADPRIAGGAPAFAAFLAAQTGDLETARSLIAKMRETSPDTRGVELTVGFWWEPDLATAREIVRRAHRGDDGQSLVCLDAYLQSLARVRAGAVVRGLPPACERGAGPDWRIRMLARQGDVEGAYAEYSKMVRPNSRRSTMFLFYPEMRAFRADPRFMPLAARLGLVDYWRTSGHWPDFCSEPDLPYDCKAVARSLGSWSAGTPK